MSLPSLLGTESLQVIAVYYLPSWLQIGAAWGTMATGLLAIGTLALTAILYKISGPRAKIKARADHNGQLRISVGNWGRVSFQVRAVGLAKRKKRRWRERGRPVSVLKLKHQQGDKDNVIMWVRLDQPEEIEPGCSDTWSFAWPAPIEQAQAHVPREFRFKNEKRHDERDPRKPGKLKQELYWQDIGRFRHGHSIKAVALLFDRQISCRVVKERDRSYRFAPQAIRGVDRANPQQAAEANEN